MSIGRGRSVESVTTMPKEIAPVRVVSVTPTTVTVAGRLLPALWIVDFIPDPGTWAARKVNIPFETGNHAVLVGPHINGCNNSLGDYSVLLFDYNPPATSYPKTFIACKWAKNEDEALEILLEFSTWPSPVKAPETVDARR